MQKITEIKEFHIFKKRKTVNGETIFVEEKVLRYREIPYVEGWARFGHFLLDYVFRLIFGLFFGVLLGLVLALTNNVEFLQDPNFDLYNRLFSWLILYPMYYFIFEFTMQASPAKAILGRVVIDEYGNKPSPKQFFIRSISKTVPLEVFSCLSTLGWHDTWSNTFVIRKKDLAELKLLQKINDIGDTSVSLPKES
ncbi:MAG: RDD family protein [Bacteroidetes bacterium]|nr:RDD family protein [Bacteroidota bacterium]